MMTTEAHSRVGTFLDAAAERQRDPLPEWTPPLRCGVDLGTATIVLTVVDAEDRPVYFDYVPEAAVRDGVVVDFHGAVSAVRLLKHRAEQALGTTLESAATAYPPGVGLEESRACRFVLEQADLECRGLVDEVSAAQALLQLSDGAIADVGGGSTGVGVYRDGTLVSLGDRPGGGHHLNLILAGALRLPLDQAEREKRENGVAHLAILRPGIERIAENIGRLMGERPTGPVHLVGGALMLPGTGRIVESYLNHPVVEHRHALLVTPFGIALSQPATGNS
ncbi:ethanolamine utilization protein EutJ [Carbonactinospora thermoautotrophica]|uniref:ethanolamine utilization protein EutJ n=1 Tax=Carbonactinospora thermoautotrophica TaxID=1469144 RepID=UPI00226DE2CF|nr:ethanolamine utilization protein EutJ [Carbonactinospora thermoautotrophica]MCX9193128.1 ethanolamine utilization protein EutJ [Carbonactinospora thermoautotrophica]